jgi:hypothetical protein
MQKPDRAEFLKVLNGMAAMKRVHLTEEAIDLWWECMRSWELGDFKLVATELMRTSKWMAEPFDFEQFKRKFEMTSGEAWTLVLEHVRSSAWEKQSALGDARIDSVVRMLGGWRSIAMSQSDSLHFLEKRFAEHYATVGDVFTARHALPGLNGKALPHIRAAVKLLT